VANLSFDGPLLLLGLDGILGQFEGRRVVLLQCHVAMLEDVASQRPQSVPLDGPGVSGAPVAQFICNKLQSPMTNNTH
jgi:hypothetical protein